MTDPKELAELLRQEVSDSPGAESRAPDCYFLEAAAALERLAELEASHDECVRFTVDKPLLQDRIARLEAALRLWKCDRVYGCLRSEVCGRCAGTGLHPIAAEALKSR